MVPQRPLVAEHGSAGASLRSGADLKIKKGFLDFLPAGDDLMRCVDLYNQTQSKWFEEMVTTCMVTARIFTAKSSVAMAAAAG